MVGLGSSKIEVFLNKNTYSFLSDYVTKEFFTVFGIIFLVNFQAEVLQGFAYIVETLIMTVCVSRKNDEVVNVCKDIVSHVIGDVGN